MRFAASSFSRAVQKTERGKTPESLEHEFWNFRFRGAITPSEFHQLVKWG
jgi:hypothetical protein